MGCWNQTCSLTNLPITAGDEIVLIPLVENFGKPLVGLRYDTNDNYEVLGFPIYGKYNDYGGIENTSTNKYNFEFFQQLEMHEYVSYGKTDTSKPIEFIPDKFETFLNDHICEESTYIIYKDEVKNFNYMMVHKELYNKLIDEMGNIIPYDQSKILRELTKERILHKLQDIETERKKWELYDDKKWFDKYIFQEKVNDCCSLGLCDTSITYDFIMESLLDNLDESLIDELTDMIIFKRVLMYLRKGYLTISGAGSQMNDLYFHKILSEFVLQFINKKIEDAKVYLTAGETFDENKFLLNTVWWRY